MTAHPGFDKIDFTGSTETGKKVVESGAATLKRITLELGGNDPGIVLPDANVASIAEPIFQSMFRHNGQVCMSLKRLYVHDSIYEEMTGALISIAKKQKSGSGFDPATTLGPIQNEAQYNRSVSIGKQIEESGVNVLFRGSVPQEERGFYFPVTLLDNPPDDAPFVTQEIFGPIRSIMRYSDVDEAIRKANNTLYGLGASAWGKDAKLLNDVSRRLRAGTVWINQHSNVSAEIPFCGHQHSGMGNQFGHQGLESYCNIQVIAQKKAC